MEVRGCGLLKSVSFLNHSTNVQSNMVLEEVLRVGMRRDGIGLGRRRDGIGLGMRLLVATYLKVFTIGALEESVSGGGEERDNNEGEERGRVGENVVP